MRARPKGAERSSVFVLFFVFFGESWVSKRNYLQLESAGTKAE